MSDHRLMPVEPTPEMLSSEMAVCTGFSGDYGIHNNHLSEDAAREVYQAFRSTAPAVQEEPSLVAWVLFDATADQKYIKMNDRDGSLAFFDSESAAQRAKHLAPGTDYKRCEYYATPQSAEQQPDVTLLLSLLSHARCNTCDGSGELYDNHRQPHQCQWCHDRSKALAAHRKGGDQ